MLNRNDIRQLTGVSILTALVVVLQLLANGVSFGGIPLNLTLCPIIIGAALYGPAAGALLGTVFGAVVVITGFAGTGGAFASLLCSLAPFAFVFSMTLKGTLSGLAAGVVYSVVTGKISGNANSAELSRENKSDISGNNRNAAVVLAGIAAPLANTLAFVLSMFIFWRETLESLAGGKNLLFYSVTGLVGVNFFIELGVNMVLAAAITSIIRYVSRHKI